MTANEYAYIIVELRFYSGKLDDFGVQPIAAFDEDREAYDFLDFIEKSHREAGWSVSEDSTTTFACDKDFQSRRYRIHRVYKYPYTEKKVHKHPEIKA